MLVGFPSRAQSEEDCWHFSPTNVMEIKACDSARFPILTRTLRVLSHLNEPKRSSAGTARSAQMVAVVTTLEVNCNFNFTRAPAGGG